MRRNLGFSRNLLLAAGMVAMLSISSLTMLTEEVLAFPDKFGIEQLYPTAGNGPVWFLDNEEPENDDNFLMTSHEEIDLEEEQEGTGRSAFELDAETGTEEHGVRIHADSPADEWKNVEMTGYFKLEEGNDQFTLIARQGPSYNDDGGCGAYGYYGMLSAEGEAYFKKKLFHHGGGYSDRTAVEENVVDNLDNRWVGIKMVVYDLAGDDVKLELWVDDGNQQNKWKKATEYIDDGDWEVSGSDCDRSSDDIIEEGTRGGFRVDDSKFEFKNLSIREINGGERGEIIAVNQQELSQCLFTYTCNAQGQGGEIIAVNQQELSQCLFTYTCNAQGQGGEIIAVNQQELSQCLFTYTCNAQGQDLAPVEEEDEEDE